MDSGNVNINILESIFSFYIKSTSVKVFDKVPFNVSSGICDSVAE